MHNYTHMYINVFPKIQIANSKKWQNGLSKKNILIGQQWVKTPSDSVTPQVRKVRKVRPKVAVAAGEALREALMKLRKSLSFLAGAG